MARTGSPVSPSAACATPCVRVRAGHQSVLSVYVLCTLTKINAAPPTSSVHAPVCAPVGAG